MFGLITQRCFHVGKATMAVTKSSFLAKLRKSTGYSVSNCKKALEMFPGDIIKAEEWLHSEAKSKGWAKWAKIQTRTAAQGLIGVCSHENAGVIIEVNCETDFVSRNAEFQQIVGKMLSGCINYATNLDIENDVNKTVLEESELSAVKCETSTLGELLIAAALKFNEKTVVKRAVCYKVKDNVLLNSQSHPAVILPNLKGASLGKYGVLLASKINEADVTEDTSSIGHDICQHIIGMNPLSVGELTDKDIAKFNAKNDSSDSANDDNVQLEQNSTAEKVGNLGDGKVTVEGQDKVNAEGQDKVNAEGQEEENAEGQDEADMTLKDTDETQLLFQPYLLDSKVTVGEILFKSGLEVLSFDRFECSENVEEQSELIQKACN